MESLILIGVAVLALVLLALLWRWRASAERDARNRAVAARTRQAFTLPPLDAGRTYAGADVAPVEEGDEDDQLEWELPSLLQLQRHFLLHALGGQPPEDGSLEVHDAGQRAVIQAVSHKLDRADLSPRYTPRRPQLLPQLIQSINDSNASSRSMAVIIGKDPVLTGNLLRLANSALYRSQPRAVDSLERAVTVVGTQGVREIISAVLMQPVLKPASAGEGRFYHLLWDYTLRTSVAAADHARSVEQEDGFTAQLMGLLLGLGTVVVMQATDDVYKRTPQLPRDPLAQLELLERYMVPTAARIARKWELSSLMFRTLRDLDHEEQDGKREMALQRSLDFGRSAAAAAMLARADLLEDARALAVLEVQVPSHVAHWIWKRLREENSESLTPA